MENLLTFTDREAATATRNSRPKKAASGGSCDCATDIWCFHAPNRAESKAGRLAMAVVTCSAPFSPNCGTALLPIGLIVRPRKPAIDIGPLAVPALFCSALQLTDSSIAAEALSIGSSGSKNLLVSSEPVARRKRMNTGAAQ